MTSKVKKSEVWDFFTKKTNTNSATCNLCGLSYKMGGGTTNLKNHLIHKHSHSPIISETLRPRSVKNHKSKCNLDLFCTAKTKRQKTATVSDSTETDTEEEVCEPESNLNEHTELIQEKVEDGLTNRIPNREVNQGTSKDLSLISTHNDELDKCRHRNFVDRSRSQSPESVSSIKSPSSSTSFMVQPTIKRLITKTQSYASGGQKEVCLTQALIYMVCKDNLPLRCTEKEGMRKFLKTAVPLYSPPSRKTITRLIEQKYATLQNVMCKKLEQVQRIAITTDIATVMNSTRSFIVLTMHYIDEERASMKCICLGVKNLTPHHTSSNICADLEEMLHQRKIPTQKIVAATTDNGANIVAGVKLLLGTIPKSSNNHFTNAEEKHVPCFAHSINLVVTKALGADQVKGIIILIDKVKAIVAYFKHSNVAQDHLRDEQKKEGKTDGTFLYLIQEVATRWNSTFYCLERFIFLSGHVGKILLHSDHKKAPPMLTTSDIEIIEECLVLLRPFEAATKDISGDKYVSASLVIPLTNCIKTAFERIKVVSPLVKLLQSELKKQIGNRLNQLETNLFLSAATILDPRFKKIHFASPLNASNAIGVVSNEVKQSLKSQGSSSPPVPIASSGLQTSTSIWSVHDEFAARQSQTIDDLGRSQQGLPTELKLYLNQPIQPRTRDPIQYWTDSKNAFPATYQIAIKYLTVLGASVPSERVVSTLNNICSDQRSRLTPNHVNQLVFLGSLDDAYWEL